MTYSPINNLIWQAATVTPADVPPDSILGQEFKQMADDGTEPLDNPFDQLTKPGRKYKVKFKENGGVSNQTLTYVDFEVDEQGNAWALFEELEIPAHNLISIH